MAVWSSALFYVLRGSSSTLFIRIFFLCLMLFVSATLAFCSSFSRWFFLPAVSFSACYCYYEYDPLVNAVFSSMFRYV